GMVPSSATASKPSPVFFTRMAHSSSSTWRRTSYSSPAAAWSMTLLHASLSPSAMSLTHSVATPNTVSAFWTTVRTSETVSASLGRQTATSRSTAPSYRSDSGTPRGSDAAGLFTIHAVPVAGGHDDPVPDRHARPP